ncbi:GTP-binding protein [Corynebacterium kutscheri]|uniref:GTPase Era n=2 Tax=Corynebacterium kutscheri TaxID=35755 RepID=A0A0F6TD85_9CORY|nr:GTPase Era [Corynebacterium kutscheri]AKE40951.1 GTP-binding protein Era [Corynebacterium kutscheri]VEH06791.1 GTP-binding protein [Corynebacterium kutscheri]VEH09250.1 GTP-binding protein [Corynebacterium kutscheri]VEH79337.1 GTP-binding protein [Corynebacterium kutscheri]
MINSDSFDAAFSNLPQDTHAEQSSFTDTPAGFRSGFISFVGRPNTGKSTLTNALVGQKIAITANQPETTRHPIRGIVHRDDAQIIVVDTPGLHRPRTLLGERLNEVVKETYSDMDLIGLTIPADEKIGPGDRWILENVRKVAPKTPILGIVTKVDKVSRDQVAAQLMALHELLGEDAEVVPVSAVTGEQREVLLEVITSLLPEGPKFYPDDHLTDDDINTRIAELIREAALSGLKQELPHSVAVEIDEILPDEEREDVLNVHAVIYVERDGQKSILIGKDGRRLGRIIYNARPEIIKLLGKNVYLDLRIKVLKNWQSDPKSLGRLGF